MDILLYLHRPTKEATMTEPFNILHVSFGVCKILRAHNGNTRFFGLPHRAQNLGFHEQDSLDFIDFSVPKYRNFRNVPNSLKLFSNSVLRVERLTTAKNEALDEISSNPHSFSIKKL